MIVHIISGKYGLLGVILTTLYGLGPFLMLGIMVAHGCGDPLSHYTCRATHVAADSRGSHVQQWYRVTPPPSTKDPVTPVVRQLPGVLHFKVSHYRGL